MAQEQQHQIIDQVTSPSHIFKGNHKTNNASSALSGCLDSRLMITADESQLVNSIQRRSKVRLNSKLDSAPIDTKLLLKGKRKSSLELNSTKRLIKDAPMNFASNSKNRLST